jgi:hypothetical protein
VTAISCIAKTVDSDQETTADGYASFVVGLNHQSPTSKAPSPSADSSKKHSFGNPASASDTRLRLSHSPESNMSFARMDMYGVPL